MQMKVVYQYSLYLIIGFIGLTCMAGGPFGIDHMITKDDNGVWSRQKQLDLQYGSFLFVVSGSLWEGKDSRLGNTHIQVGCHHNNAQGRGREAFSD